MIRTHDNVTIYNTDTNTIKMWLISGDNKSMAKICLTTKCLDAASVYNGIRGCQCQQQTTMQHRDEEASMHYKTCRHIQSCIEIISVAAITIKIKYVITGWKSQYYNHFWRPFQVQLPPNLSRFGWNTKVQSHKVIKNFQILLEL